MQFKLVKNIDGGKVLIRKAPMTADEARANIAEMRANTKPAAMRRLIAIALGPLGNLSEEAKEVYRNA